MTLAAIVVDIVKTGPSVSAGRRRALVNVDVTVVARVAGAGAVTCVAIQFVDTASIMEAGLQL